MFKRLSRIVRSFFGFFISVAENPEIILEQNIRDMNDQVPRMNESIAMVKANVTLLEKEESKYKYDLDNLTAKIKAAIQAGRDDLAGAFATQLEQLKGSLARTQGQLATARSAFEKAMAVKQAFMREKERKTQEALNAIRDYRRAQWQKKVADSMEQFEIAGISQTHSDIHIEPGRAVTRVRCRVDGLLQQTTELPRWMHDNLVVRIKVLARLDVSDRRIPQDGHIAADAPGGDDARVSTVPSRWGEKVVIRILKRARAALSLTQLGFQPRFEERLHTWIQRTQGILFVVGPTGSGKTTTLYALLNELRDDPLNITTIEDPIEYEIDRITQIQINDKAGLTFARVLRAILRQDPDVILVGEIRDAETAKIAVHAAMTGHLVLSTLHATDSVSAISRLTELGIDRGIAASVILGVVGQRLVRLNCERCIEQEFPRIGYLDCLGIPHHEQARLRHSSGCPACRFTGSSGRVGLYELMEMEGPVREACFAGDEADLRKAARDAGVVSLKDQAVELALSGRISVREAYRSGYFGGE